MTLKDFFNFKFGKAEEIPARNPIISHETKAKHKFSEIPLFLEKPNQEWITWGSDNMLPEIYTYCYETSPLHSAIVKRKTKMIHGKGFTVNGVPVSDYIKQLPVKEAVKVESFFRNPAGNASLFEVVSRGVLDNEIFGNFSFEVVWNEDRNEIVAIKHIPTRYVRSGKLNGDKVENYFVCKDWKKAASRFVVPKEFQSFNGTPSAEDKKCQVYFGFKYDPSNEWYGTPSYHAALDDIYTHSSIAAYHANALQNDFAPSMLIQVIGRKTKEEAEQIYNDIQDNFVGLGRKQKMVLDFIDNKEDATIISPIQSNGDDTKFIQLRESISSAILSAHGVTDPELFGISVPGKLGNSDILKSNAIFTEFETSSIQATFLRFLEEMAKCSGLSHLKIGFEKHSFEAEKTTNNH